MQSLASLLHVSDRPFTVDTSDPEEVDRFLMDLPPTAEIEAHVADLRGKIDAPDVNEDSDFARFRRQRIAEQLRLAERKLALCQQRDALLATRPDGCFCLGMGGRGARYTSTGERVYERYCPACPEGAAGQRRSRELAEEARRQSEAARSARLFGAARVPSRFKDCTFDSYPVSEETRAALADVRLWQEGPPDGASPADLEAWRTGRRTSLFLYGPYGTGKTGLAVSVLRGKLEIHGGGLFFTVPSLLDAIRATYAPNALADERQVIEAVKTAPFLVLDDLGAERVTDWVAEKLFTIINYRHDEDLPTVFTSNLDIPQLAQHIGERTAWRVVEMSKVVKMDGPNLRARP